VKVFTVALEAALTSGSTTMLDTWSPHSLAADASFLSKLCEHKVEGGFPNTQRCGTRHV
jgi:hypothetical protein